ncbi:hypothetical protein [Clostridium tagluense]|uniref:hypothetical protein n=1 Tax=Clostridium tagluense TaxID=360422 RepID=UPI001C0C00E8|nr:hypothetical protein [Clostridium tagluense]MBU3126735.1 hypothetical protein [Clostridium tagluense]
MANLSTIIIKIRTAILGVEVRGSIADGIEAINTEVVSTTARQAIVEGEQALVGQKEASIQIAEAIRNGNEEKRKSTFNSNEIDRVNRFAVSEFSRQSTVAQLEDIFNNSTITGNLPMFIDGGDYGDTNIGTTYNGGDY